MPGPRRTTPRSGMTLIELSIGLTVVTVLMLIVSVAVQREARSLKSVTNRSDAERRASIMLDRIEAELEYAQAANPGAWLTADLGAAGGIVQVDDTSGFPDVGTLLIDAGELGEERLDCTLVDGTHFDVVTHGVHCTAGALHGEGEQVWWSSQAYHIDDQTSPAAWRFDGISQELSGQVFFRGEGTGFSFRTPVDFDGDGDLYDGDDVGWGATVEGVSTADGWSALLFEPVAVVSEADRDFDFNRDGDRDDQFDLGRVRLRSWDAANPGRATDVALCSPMILQEQCNWGGDLDADGFDDPMFLWDPVTGRVRIRLFLLTGALNDRPQVRSIESTTFLRNGLRP